jgi:hypothetical protein
MTAWTEEELGRIGEAEELQLASERPDGTLRPHVTIWVVRVDCDGGLLRAHRLGCHPLPGGPRRGATSPALGTHITPAGVREA